MLAIEAPHNMRNRHEVTYRAATLDTLLQPAFDAIVDAASRVCDVPIALVSIVESDRQWFRAKVGLPGVEETPRSVAFCDHAVRDARLFEVPDATRDARFANNPLVLGDPNIRFYAGAPIVLPDGDRIGTVCVIDREAGRLSDAQRAMLESLSAIAGACIVAASRHVAMTRALVESEERYRSIVEDQTELISLAEEDGTLSYVNPAYARHFGRDPQQMVGTSLFQFVEPDDRAAVRAHWGSVCQHDRSVSDVNRMVSAEGRPRWVAWTNRTIRDAEGTIIAVQSVGRDISEQKATEQALIDSELRLRVLYEATPAILHSIDAEGRLLSVSDLWLQTFGYERSEVIGRRSSEFLTPESALHARQAILPEFFRTGQCDRVEYRFVRKDGVPVDVLLSARLERDRSGSPIRSLAVLEDVTQARQMAAELSRTHASLDAIVENVPALMGQWDLKSNALFVNREFQAAVGLPLEQIVGHSLRDVFEAVDPMAYAALEPHIEQVLLGRREEFETAVLTVSGLRQLRFTLVPDRQPSGQVVGYYGMAHDITGHKALELRLGDSEQRYRSLFENLNSGFALHEIVVASDGKPIDYKFLAMNDAFSAMTGLIPQRTIGRRVTEVLPETAADPANWIGVFGRVALTGEPTHFEQRSAAMDRCFEVVAYRPAPGQFAVIAQDITARKEAETQLQGALRDKETLLKEVYHRVKNNLQVVQSLLNLQRRSLPAGEARTALEDSVQRVRAMALVHEKLYQSGNLAAVSLLDYTQDLLKQIGDSAGAGSRVRLSAYVPPVRAGLDSAIPFGLLVTELVGNALKHGFPNHACGVIQVQLSVEGDDVVLSVADDGVGLPIGFSLQSTKSMGLQLAANLATQLGGVLSATSQQGATFSARLPRLQ